jgi:protein-disulfide isomerase
MLRRVALAALVSCAAVAGAEEVPTAGSTRLGRALPDAAPARGPRDAPVIVDFFCNDAHIQCTWIDRLLRLLAERHPDGLRVVYRQVVLPMRDSEVVAEATLEAFAQGRFDAFAEVAGAAGNPVRARDLDGLAVRAGLDLDAVHAAIATRRHAAAIDRDAALRERLGVGTSALAWNGEIDAPDLNLDAFERAFERADARARAHLAEGVPRARLYATLVREAARARARTEPRAPRVEPSPPRVRLRTDGAPVRGAADADVNVVVFGDFERPLWRRQDELLARLAAVFPGHVRVAYKLFPQARDPSARAVAELAACAHLQGRFWELHDALFVGTPRLLGADVERAAELAGLDLARYREDRAAGRCAARVEADLAEGRALGVEYTPTMFVNGIKLVGIRGLGDLRSVVEGEIRPGLLEELTAQ